MNRYVASPVANLIWGLISPLPNQLLFLSTFPPLVKFLLPHLPISFNSNHLCNVITRPWRTRGRKTGYGYKNFSTRANKGSGFFLFWFKTCYRPNIMKMGRTKASTLPFTHSSTLKEAPKEQKWEEGKFPSPTRHSAQEDAVTLTEAEAMANPFPVHHSMVAPLRRHRQWYSFMASSQAGSHSHWTRLHQA